MDMDRSPGQINAKTGRRLTGFRGSIRTGQGSLLNIARTMASPGLSEAETWEDESSLPLPDRTVPNRITQPGGADHSITLEWNRRLQKLAKIN